MTKYTLLLLSLFSTNLFCINAPANELFAKADAAAGKSLADKNCVSCHTASFGGDGSAIYTRDFAKVTTSKGLLAQVRSCNINLGLKWFEDEELNVAAYLNNTYYKLAK